MKNTKWLVIAILVIVGYLWWVGATPFNQPAAPAKTEKAEEEAVVAKNAVEMKDFSFRPATLTVKVGDTVTWTNRDIAGHSATADDGTSFNTGVLAQGENGTVTFSKAGTFTYYCTLHPSMKATVVVTE